MTAAYHTYEKLTWGVPKIMRNILRVPLIRNIVFWAPY